MSEKGKGKKKSVRTPGARWRFILTKNEDVMRLNFGPQRGNASAYILRTTRTTKGQAAGKAVERFATPAEAQSRGDKLRDLALSKGWKLKATGLTDSSALF